MGVNKRHITDEMIIQLFKSEGVDRVMKLYQNADVTTSQGELAKNVSRIINDPEILFTNPMVVKESVLQEIYRSLGIEQTKK